MTTILIIDDEADVRAMWAIALRAAGHRTMEASDGAEGLHYARTKHPDLVISDLLMPTMGGVEFVRQLRADPSTANIPVILMTGIFQEEEGRRLAEACGVHHLLSKPCRVDKIIDVVDTVLSTPACRTALAENLDHEHLKLLNNTLVAKIRELEMVNQRIEQQVAELERTAQALRDNDRVLRHFTAIVACSDDAIISKKLDGTILSWNPAAERIYGYSAAEVIGHSINLLAPLDGVGEFQNVLKRLGNGEPLNHFETVHSRKDGRLVHVSFTISPIQNAVGQLIAACTIARDITEDKQAEWMMRDQARVLDLIFEHSLDCIVLLDKDYNFIRVNQAYAKACGRAASEFPGHNHFELYPSPLKEEFDEAIRHRVAFSRTARPFTFPDHPEWGVTYWDLSMVSIRNENDDIELLLFTLRDVTERQRTEDKLRASESRFRVLVEQATDAIFLHGPEGLILDANPRACESLGYTRDELIGMSIAAIDPVVNRDTLQRIGDQLNAGQQVALDTTHQRKDGSTFPVEVRINPFHYDGRRVALSVVRDITERKRTDQALVESRNRLESLSRQLITTQETERKDLARELHDEIGQSLTAMRILCETGACPRGPQVLDLVTELMERVRNLSFDLRPPMLDPLGLLPAMLWNFERYSKATGIHVVFQHSGVEKRFSSELEIAVYRIVQEALTNVARHAGVTEATVQLWADADTLGIQATDQGKGFVPDAVMAEGRTGGLTGILERVELLGGEIEIESSPGQGTFITVQFPLAMDSENEEGKQ